MSQILELPETLFRALEKQAQASGTTPQGWIAARLAELDAASGQGSSAPSSMDSINGASMSMTTGVKASMEVDLRKLAALPNNWDGYGAPPLNPAILSAAIHFVRALPEDIERAPRVVPMSPGNVQLEWHHGPKVLELEFESPQSIRYLQWDPPAGVEQEDSFPISELDRAADLIRWFMSGLAA